MPKIMDVRLIGLVAAVAITLTGSEAWATCSESCEAIPLADMATCELVTPTSSCDGMGDDCVPSPAGLFYEWSGDDPIRVLVTCVTTCCAPGPGDEGSCSSSESELEGPWLLNLLDEEHAEVGATFSEVDSTCDGQVFVMDDTIAEPGLYYLSYDHMIMTNIDVTPSTGGSDCRVAPRVTAESAASSLLIVALSGLAIVSLRRRQR